MLTICRNTIDALPDAKSMNRQDARAARSSTHEPEEPIDRLASSVIAAAIEVHATLGPGFLESVYEEALAIELSDREIPFVRQPPIGIEYKGRAVGSARPDLLVAERLIVELKTIDAFSTIHLAQTLSYLKATKLPLGLLINFNVPVLLRGVRRVVRTDSRQ